MAKDRVVSKLKQTRGIDMREKILKTAERYFCENGYMPATTRKLSEAAGIAVGSFYFYFKDKEELLLEVYRRQSGRFLVTIADALKNAEQYKTDKKSWLKVFICHLLQAYGNSGKLRAELKAVTWKNAHIAEQKKIIKQETLSAVTRLLCSSPMIEDVCVHRRDLAFLLVIDIMDATYERLAESCSPEDREDIIQECADAVYRYLFLKS